VTTGTIRRVQLQSNCHHQQTNTQLFHRPYALHVAQPACQSTEGKSQTTIHTVIINLHRKTEGSPSLVFSTNLTQLKLLPLLLLIVVKALNDIFDVLLRINSLGTTSTTAVK